MNLVDPLALKESILQDLEKLKASAEAQVLTAQNLEKNNCRDIFSEFVRAIDQSDKTRAEALVVDKFGQEFLDQISSAISNLVAPKAASAPYSKPTQSSDIPKLTPDSSNSQKSVAPGSKSTSVQKPKTTEASKAQGGIFKRLFGKGGSSGVVEVKATEMILNENEQKHYYCQIKKRWVFEGDPEEDDAPPPPPPKKDEVTKLNSEAKKEVKPQQPKSVLDELTAPPATGYTRNNKKGSKAVKKPPQPVGVPAFLPSVELPDTVTFDVFKTKLSEIFDKLASVPRTQLNSGSAAGPQLSEELQSQIKRHFDQSEEISKQTAELLNGTQDLLLSTSFMPPMQLEPIKLVAFQNLTTNKKQPKDSGHKQVAQTVTSIQVSEGAIHELEERHDKERSRYLTKIEQLESQILQLGRELKNKKQQAEWKQRSPFKEQQQILPRSVQNEKEIEKYRDEIQALRDNIDVLNEETQRLRQTYENQLKRMQSQWEREYENLRTQQSDNQSGTVMAMQTQLQTLRRELTDSIRKNKQLQHEINQKSRQLEQSEILYRRFSERSQTQIKLIDELQQALKEKDATLGLMQANEACLKKCYNSVLKTNSNLQLIDECLSAEQHLLEKIRRKRVSLAETSRQQQSGLPDVTRQPQEFQSNISHANFIQMSCIISQIIVKSDETIKAHHIRNQQLESQLAAWNDRSEQLRSRYESKIKTLNAQLCKYKAVLDNYRQDGTETSLKVQVLKKEKLRLEKQIDKLRHDDSFSKSLIEQSTKNLAVQTRKYQETSANLERLRAQNKMLEKECETLRVQKSDLEYQWQKTEHERQQVQLQYNEAVATLNESHAQIEEEQNELLKKKQELHELSMMREKEISDYETLFESYNQLDKENNELIQRVRTLESSVKVQTETIQTQESARQSAESERDELLHLLSEKDDLVASLQAGIELSRKNEMSALESVKSLQEQIETHQSQKDYFQARIQELAKAAEKDGEYQRLIKEMEATIAQFRNDNDELTQKTAVMQHQFTEAQIRLQRLTQQLNSRDTELESLRQDNNQLTEALALQQEELQRVRNDTSRWNELVSKHQRELQEHRANTRKFEHLVSENAQVISKLQDKNEKLNEAYVEKAKQLDRLIKQNAELMEVLSLQEANANQIQEQLREAAGRLVQRDEEIERIREQYTKQTAHFKELARMAEESAKMHSELRNAYEQELQMKTSTISELRELVASISKERDDLQEQISTQNIMQGELDYRLEGVQEDNQTQADQIKKLKQQVEKRDEDLRAIQIAQQEKEQLLLLMSEELEELKVRQVQSKPGNTEEASRQEVSRLEQQIALLQEQLSSSRFQFQQTMSLCNQKLNKYEQQLASLTMQKLDQNSSIEAMKQHYQNTFTRYMETADNSDKNVRMLLQEKSELEALNQKYEAKIKQLQSDIQTKQRLLDVARSERANASETTAQDQSELQQILQEQESKIQSLEEKLQQYQQIIGKGHETTSSLEHQIKDLQARNEQLINTTVKLEQTIEQLHHNAQIMQATNTQLIHKVDELEATKALNLKRIEDLTLEIGLVKDASSTQVDSLREFIKEKETKEGILEAKIKKLETELALPKNSEMKKIMDKLKSLQQENDELMKQKVEMLRNSGELVEETSNLRRQVAELQKNKSITIPAPVAESTSPTAKAKVPEPKKEEPVSKPAEVKSPKLPEIKEIPVVKKSPAGEVSINNTTQPPSTGAPGTPKPSSLMSTLSKYFLTEKEQKSVGM